MFKKIIIAISKGRTLINSLIYLYYKNIFININFKINRKLYLKTNKKYFYIIILKNLDILKFLKKNLSDIFIFGNDVLFEKNINIFFKIYKLNIEKFFLSIISKKNLIYKIKKKKFFLNITTKYKKIAKNFLKYKNINFKIEKLNGGLELSLILKKSDIILDIVSSGKTIKENNMFNIENIINLNYILVINLNLLYNKIYYIFFKNFFKNEFNFKYIGY